MGGLTMVATRIIFILNISNYNHVFIVYILPLSVNRRSLQLFAHDKCHSRFPDIYRKLFFPQPNGF